MGLQQVQHLWAKLVTSSGYSSQTIELVGTLIVQILAFWIPSFIYISLDELWPAVSRRHKLQSQQRQPSRRDIRQCFTLVMQNQLLATALHWMKVSATRKGILPSSYRVEAAFPSGQEFARDFVLSLLMREAMFYYVHRLFHEVPWLYKKIHKRHHRFVAPVALAAQYAHPVEHIFANTLPITLPPQILGSHILTFWAYLAFELFGTATVHSGYDFFAGKARMHDLHHEKFNLNYGSIGLCDYLHGTNELKRKTL